MNNPLSSYPWKGSCFQGQSFSCRSCSEKDPIVSKQPWKKNINIQYDDQSEEEKSSPWYPIGRIYPLRFDWSMVILLRTSFDYSNQRFMAACNEISKRGKTRKQTNKKLNKLSADDDVGGTEELFARK